MLAQEAAHQLGLDEVLLMPTGSPPHKRIDPEPGAEVRLELARRAAAGDELLEASDLEVAGDGPSYTFHTLESLSASRPDDEIHFLMGADVAAELESWKRPERVLELARLAIAAGPGPAWTRRRLRSRGWASPIAPTSCRCRNWKSRRVRSGGGLPPANRSATSCRTR